MKKRIKKVVKKALKQTYACKSWKRSLVGDKYDFVLSGKNGLCYIYGSIACNDEHLIVSVDLPIGAREWDDECAGRLTQFANHANNAVFVHDVKPMLKGRFSFVGYEEFVWLGVVRYCEWLRCDGRWLLPETIEDVMDRVASVACKYFKDVIEVALGGKSAWDAAADRLGSDYRLSFCDPCDWLAYASDDTFLSDVDDDEDDDLEEL